MKGVRATNIWRHKDFNEGRGKNVANGDNWPLELRGRQRQVPQVVEGTPSVDDVISLSDHLDGHLTDVPAAEKLRGLMRSGDFGQEVQDRVDKVLTKHEIETWSSALGK